MVQPRARSDNKVKSERQQIQGKDNDSQNAGAAPTPDDYAKDSDDSRWEVDAEAVQSGFINMTGLPKYEFLPLPVHRVVRNYSQRARRMKSWGSPACVQILGRIPILIFSTVNEKGVNIRPGLLLIALFSSWTLSLPSSSGATNWLWHTCLRK